MAVWLAMHACDLRDQRCRLDWSPYAEQNPVVFGRIERLKHCDSWINMNIIIYIYIYIYIYMNSIMGSHYFTILNLPPLLVQEFDACFDWW